MTTAPTINRGPAIPPMSRPGPTSGGPSAGGGSGSGLGMVTIDPVRLILRYWPVLGIAAFLGAALGVAAHFAFVFFAPQYTASVTFVVQPPIYDPTRLDPTAQSNTEVERFMGTQVAQMTADTVLETAVNSPDVRNTEWAKPFIKGGVVDTKEAVQQLMKDLGAGPIPMTDLIRLSVKYKNAENAATIANAVSRAYLNDLQKFSRANTSERRDAMRKRLAEIDDELRRLRDSVTRLVESSGQPTLTPGESQEDYQMREILASLTELTKSRSMLVSYLERDEKELAKAQAIVYPSMIESQADQDPIIADLRQQVSSLNIELRTLRERQYLEDHPTVQQIKDRIRATEIELQTKRESVLKQMFSAQLDEYRSQIDGLNRQESKLTSDLDALNKRREELRNLRLKKETLDQDIERLVAERIDINRTFKGLDDLAVNSAFERVKIIRQAQTPNKLSFPRLMFMLPAGFFLVTGLVSGLIVLREVFDQRVRGPADLAVIPRMHILGVIPEASEDPTRVTNVQTCFKAHPTSVVSESFRQVRSLLAKRMDTTGAKSLLVLGGMPGSGATTIVANLAMSLAGLDEKVLIIDANMRRPGIHKAFGVLEGPGLGDVLTGEASAESAIQDSGVRNLHVLSAGSPATRGLPERLGGEAFARLLGEVGAKYDRIIVDSSPAIVSGDGLALANRCDAVALVVKAGGEKRGLVNRLRSNLAEVRGEFVGVIVNAVRHSAGGYFRKNIEATHKYQSIQP